ncbi:hypothetical protein ACLESO_50840 [Pyxidicoccus sp. 3LG]
MRLAYICVGVLATGCAARGVPEQPAGVPVSGAVAPAAVGGSGAQAPIVFEGMCDASGAVALGGELFVVGDDEDNVLRVYDARRGGAPVQRVDLSPDLELPIKKKPPEATSRRPPGWARCPSG